MSLRDIFKKHGTDKADHGYAAFYETLPEPVAMLECGVFRGASLRAWRERWPHARIVGVDTFQRGTAPDLGELDVELIEADCRTANLAEHALLDLIVDDASHRPRDQAQVFRNLWPLLAPGGTYVIEDFLFYDRPLPKWFRDREDDFNVEAGCDVLDAITDAGVIFTIYDYRDQSGKPDSVLLVVRKPV